MDLAVGPAAERLNRTEVAQPAVFAVGWALATVVSTWGSAPRPIASCTSASILATALCGSTVLPPGPV